MNIRQLHYQKLSSSGFKSCSVERRHCCDPRRIQRVCCLQSAWKRRRLAAQDAGLQCPLLAIDWDLLEHKMTTYCNISLQTATVTSHLWTCRVRPAGYEGINADECLQRHAPDILFKRNTVTFWEIMLICFLTRGLFHTYTIDFFSLCTFIPSHGHLHTVVMHVQEILYSAGFSTNMAGKRDESSQILNDSMKYCIP